MMSFPNKFSVLAAASAVAMALSSPAQAVSYSFVGQWAVADGPLWTEPTTVPMSGRQTAAFLFGGIATDYAISTAGASVATINFKTFLDGRDDIRFLTTPADQDFVGVFGANYSAGIGNFSAYVFDHACGTHYCTGGGGESAINYAFRVSNNVGVAGVPEPSSWALLIAGFGLVGLVGRRRSHSHSQTVTA